MRWAGTWALSMLGVAHRDPFRDQVVFVGLGPDDCRILDLALDLVHDVANGDRSVELDRHRKRGRGRDGPIAVWRDDGGERAGD